MKSESLWPRGKVPGAASSRTLSDVHSVGVDIGGTTIKAARITDGGQLEDPLTRPTPTQPDELVDEVVGLLEHYPPELPAGVAVAAFLDSPRRNVVMSPNISWSNRPLAAELEQRSGRAVYLENDANAAGWAEFCAGAGKGAHSMVMLTLGTGVGGAVIIGDRLIDGSRGLAAELGHIVVEPGGRVCGCGQRGCVETVSSGTAMMRAVAEASGHAIDSPDALESELAADPGLRRVVVDAAAQGIVLALVNLQAVLDPEVAVIGGGVADRLGQELMDSLVRAHRELVSSRRSTAFPEFRQAQMGNQAGMVGAGLLARPEHHAAQ